MTRFQTTALVTLRILVGWHFCYEGLAKLWNPYWSSAGYLADSRWILRPLLIRVAADPTAIRVVDLMNEWGLLLIGAGLLLGVFTRAATIAGIVLLALYWLSAPPLPGASAAMPAEGSYLLVNKVLVELGALLVLLAYPTGRTFGLDALLPWGRRGGAAGAAQPAEA